MTRDGVLVIDKPRGPTSHAVVARVRRVLRRREIGHAGTLDPIATGVLVVAIGEATKLVPYLTAETKSYETTIALGVETDTLDAEGKETARVPPMDAIRAALARSSALRAAPEIASALATEIARTSQVPPAFSAIRQAGERAYDKARRGETPELAARAVRVMKLELLEASDDPPSIALSLEVTKGYYVRSLARDLAASLGTVGHLTALRRTRSGSFSLNEALAFDTPADELAARIVPLAHAAARVLPVAQLTESGVRDARHGRPVRAEDIDASSNAPHAWLDPNGELVAIGSMKDDGTGQVLRGFAAPPTSS
jgi:tRNA pseudouridine55 synthase